MQSRTFECVFRAAPILPVHLPKGSAPFLSKCRTLYSMFECVHCDNLRTARTRPRKRVCMGAGPNAICGFNGWSIATSKHWAVIWGVRRVVPKTTHRSTQRHIPRVPLSPLAPHGLRPLCVPHTFFFPPTCPLHLSLCCASGANRQIKLPYRFDWLPSSFISWSYSSLRRVGVGSLHTPSNLATVFGHAGVHNLACRCSSGCGASCACCW